MAGCPSSATIGCREAAPPLPTHLARVVEARFPDAPHAASLTGAFLALNRFDRRFAAKLVRLGRGGNGASWDLRLLAAMMLENQCLRLKAGDTSKIASVLEHLGVLAHGAGEVHADVLLQGYTSVELSAFSAQFLRHLGRLARIHGRLHGYRTASEALDDFILISRDACKVALARYLFTPEEVVARVEEQFQLSEGIAASLDETGLGEAQHYLSHLPAYELEIVRLLNQSAHTYWAGERTSAAINRLLENPIGTVACVVKPPGSALEFEIKRTGIGGTFPLGATFIGHNGNPVPASHRLQGGSSIASLRWESDHAAILAEAYRVAHGREAPLSKVLALKSYRRVPCQGRDVHLFDYFTDPEVFGPGYEKMRQQMQLCVSAFDKQFGSEFAHLPGEAGLTGRFLFHVLPCQGLLAQTTSYRLDTLAGYLSPAGAEAYFRKGLRRESHGCDEARRFADAVLEEVLGIYRAPEAAYLDHAQYLEAAFAIPENRRRADHLHAAAVSEIGLLWGTLLALGGFSHGESFVARNVGLKSWFAGGEWTSRLISMDHDNLHIPDADGEVFWAQGALRTAEMDEAFIRGNPGSPNQIPRSTLYFLEKLFHLHSADAPRDSGRGLELAMTTAYRRTRWTMENDPGMEKLFSKSYLRHLRAWQLVVADYLNTVRQANSADLAAWQERTRVYLARHKYHTEVADNYCKAMETHGDFVRRYSFLYLPPPA